MDRSGVEPDTVGGRTYQPRSPLSQPAIILRVVGFTPNALPRPCCFNLSLFFGIVGFNNVVTDVVNVPDIAVSAYRDVDRESTGFVFEYAAIGSRRTDSS